jgi:fucose permease
LSPLLTRYSLIELGWETTVLIFIYLLIIGLVTAFFITTPKIPVGSTPSENNQTAMEAIKEAFSSKSYNYLTLGFFVVVGTIALVATHIPTYVNDEGFTRLVCCNYFSFNWPFQYGGNHNLRIFINQI